MWTRNYAKVTFILLIIAVTGAYVYLFRVEEQDNPQLGKIFHHYKWGVPRVVHSDTNRDGMIDFRAIMDAKFGSPKTHTPALEYWEDLDHDGIFEYHVVMSNNSVQLVEVDKDGDGLYESELTDEQIAILFESRRLRSHSY